MNTGNKAEGGGRALGGVDVTSGCGSGGGDVGVWLKEDKELYRDNR